MDQPARAGRVEEVGDRVREDLGEVVVAPQDPGEAMELCGVVDDRWFCCDGSHDPAAHVETDLCSFKTSPLSCVSRCQSAWLPQYTDEPGDEATEGAAILITTE
jgi:hypothetical protein